MSGRITTPALPGSSGVAAKAASRLPSRASSTSSSWETEAPVITGIGGSESRSKHTAVSTLPSPARCVSFAAPAGAGGGVARTTSRGGSGVCTRFRGLRAQARAAHRSRRVRARCSRWRRCRPTAIQATTAPPKRPRRKPRPPTSSRSHPHRRRRFAPRIPQRRRDPSTASSASACSRTAPTLISGGDALVEVVVPDDVDPRGRSRRRRRPRRHGAFALRADGTFSGLVDGLALGRNEVVGHARRARRARPSADRPPDDQEPPRERSGLLRPAAPAVGLRPAGGDADRRHDPRYEPDRDGQLAGQRPRGSSGCELQRGREVHVLVPAGNARHRRPARSRTPARRGASSPTTSPHRPLRPTSPASRTTAATRSRASSASSAAR